MMKSDQPKKITGITAEQLRGWNARWRRCSKDLKCVESRYGDDVLNLVIQQIGNERGSDFGFIALGVGDEITYSSSEFLGFASPSGAAITPLVVVGTVPVTAVISPDGRNCQELGRPMWARRRPM